MGASKSLVLYIYIDYRSVLRKMSVGLLVWWVFIEDSKSMVGMVSLDALLLV